MDRKTTRLLITLVQEGCKLQLTDYEERLINPEESIPAPCRNGMCVKGGVNIHGYTKDNRYVQYDCPFKNFHSRLDKSEMYKENQVKFIEDFKWDAYGIDIKTLEKKRDIINSFVFNMQEWFKEGIGIYLYSETTGTGKTFLASILLNEAALQRYDIMFVDCEQLIYELTEEKYRKDRDRESENISISERIKNADIIVVDEIGVNQQFTQNSQKVLLSFINGCKDSGKLVIYTSNTPISKLNIGNRAIDRITRNTIQIAMPEVNIRNRDVEKRQKEFLNRVLDYKKD